MSKRNVTIARILMLLYIAALAYLCFGHFSNLPQISRKFLNIDTDKIVHFIMFLPFPVLFYFCIGKNPRNAFMALLAVLGIFLAGCLIAAGTEIGQKFIPDRASDPKDFLADSIALGLSSLAVFIIMVIKGIKQSRTAK